MKTGGNSLLCAALALGLACSAALAKPNFSGEWKLDADKSDFGPFPKPSKFVRKIDQQGPNLHLVTTRAGQRGEFTTDLKYTTDGKECTNTVRGQEITSTAKWDGDALVIDSKGSLGGAEVTFHETWTLSKDGKALNIATHIKSPQGEVNLKLVLEKQ